ncbi:MAG: hypothetical protein IJ292_02055 [Clostridia bacterium]|nr:hypothetical protein [Clostridia bacterium]
MEHFEQFDKINVPLYICTDKWIILYRNKACRKLSSSPRVNSNLCRYFLEKENTPVPAEDGGCLLVGSFIKDVYKTALCFRYKEYVIVAYPSLFDFDIMMCEVDVEGNRAIADSFREVIDLTFLSKSNFEDKYSTLEKIRKYVFNIIDNYVALSMFDTDKRVLGTFSQIYGFFESQIGKTVNKTGYRVNFDLTGIEEFGKNIYVDTTCFSMVLSSVMMFCLSLSADKRCIVRAEHLGMSVRNSISFTYKDTLITGRDKIDFSYFMALNPMEYINFLPIEQMSRALGWGISCLVSDEKEFNCSIVFDTAIDNKSVFRKGGKKKAQTPEDVMSAIFKNTLRLLA